MNKDKFISTFISLISNTKPTDELEIKYHSRFRGFESDKWTPSISCNQFYEFIKLFKADPFKHTPERTYTSTNITLDSSHPLSGIRLQKNCDDEQREEFTRKTRSSLDKIVDNNGIFPQGFKISLSSENQCTKQEEKQFLALLNKIDKRSINTRHIERHSFVEEMFGYPVFRYDLSKVTNEKSEPHFEIEMEYIGNKLDFNVEETYKQKIPQVASQFVSRLVWILKTIQNTPVGMTLQQHNTVFIDYVKLVGLYDKREEYGDYWKRDVFIGCQPESIHYRSLSKLWLNDYVIVDKSDGERRLLFINNGFLYTIDRFMHISRLNHSLVPQSVGDQLNGTLLDTEWFKDKSLIVVFDVLFINNQDHRNETTLARLQLGERIVETLTSNANGLKICVKPFLQWLPKTPLKSSDVYTLQKTDYKTDGFICIPNTSCPKTRKWADLLKWKPKHLNSIDLYVEESGESIDEKTFVYNLMIQTNLVTYKGKHYLLFRKFSHASSSSVSNPPIYWLIDFNNNIIEVNVGLDESRIVTVRSVSIPFPFQPVATLSSPLIDCSVYEFVFDYNTALFVPALLRTDKTTKGYLGSNHLTVAVDLWDSIYHPMDMDVFDSLNSETIATYYNIGFNHPEQLKTTLSPDFDLRLYESQLVETDLSGDLYSSTRRTGKSAKRSSRKRTDKKSIETSPIWKIRKYHNYIKRLLIDKYSTSNRLTVHQVFVNLGATFDPNYNDYVFKNWNVTFNHLLSFLNIDRELLSVRNDDRSKMYLSKTIVDNLLRVRYEPPFDLSKHPKKPDTVFSVLDLCCGKGGDLWKYSNNPIRNLVCVDNEAFLLDQSEEDSAIERWSSVKDTNSELHTVFIGADARDDLVVFLKEKELYTDFDMISCFFAIHYLFESHESLDKFMKNVSNLLTYNGCFIGVMVDGRKVYDNIHGSGKFEHYLESEEPKQLLYSIKPVSPSITKCAWAELDIFGNEIDVTLNDSIIHEYIGLQPNKKEYLVNFEKFVEIAKHYSLEIVESVNFEEFYPDYSGAKLNNAEKKFSFIYRTFAFRKTANSTFQSKEYQSKLSKDVCIQSFNTKLREIERYQLENLKVDNMLSHSVTTKQPVLNQTVPPTSVVVAESPVIIQESPVVIAESPVITTESPVVIAESSTKKQKVSEAPSSKEVPTTQGCGHRGKSCVKCMGCACKKQKQKCVEGVCGCSDQCTNR